MKQLLLMILMLLQSEAMAQIGALEGEWVSKQHDMLVLMDGMYDPGYLCAAGLKEQSFNRVIVSGDTIDLQERYTSSLTDFKVEYINHYKLKVLSRNDSVLVVRPVSDLSKKFFQGRKSISFTNRAYLFDKSINLEKIVFHSGSAWGSPVIGLEITKDRRMYLSHNNLYEAQNSLKTGNYEAVLDDSLYQGLITELQNCQLRTLKFHDILVKDASEITMIIYFNGRRKYLRSLAPPRLARDLITCLYGMISSVDLRPASVTRKLEE